MPLIADLSADAGTEFAIASNLGSTVGGFMRDRRQKAQLAEQKQKKQLQQAFTIKGLNSGLKGQELHAFMNKIPEFVESEQGRIANEKMLQQRMLSPTDSDQDVSALQRLREDRQKLFKWNGVMQQFVLIPGSEELLKGYDLGIKNALDRIAARQKARTAGVEDVAGVARQQLGIGNEVAETDLRPAVTPTDAVPQGVVGAGVGHEVAEAIDARSPVDAGTPTLGDVSGTETLDDIVEAANQKVHQGLPRPTTQAEYDAIPKGASFIDTDGKEKRKL